MHASITEDACIRFYNKKEPVYLETNTIGVGLGTGLLQVRDGIYYPKDIAPENTIV